MSNIYIYIEQTRLFYIFQEMPNVDIDVKIYFSKWFMNWYAISDHYKYVAWIFVFFFPIHTKTYLTQNSHLARDMLAIQHSPRHWKFWVLICSMFGACTSNKKAKEMQKSFIKNAKCKPKNTKGICSWKNQWIIKI